MDALQVDLLEAISDKFHSLQMRDGQPYRINHAVQDVIREIMERPSDQLRSDLLRMAVELDIEGDLRTCRVDFFSDDKIMTTSGEQFASSGLWFSEQLITAMSQLFPTRLAALSPIVWRRLEEEQSRRIASVVIASVPE